MSQPRPSPARRRAADSDWSILYWPIAKLYGKRIAHYMRENRVHAKIAYYNITGRDLTNIGWARVERAIARLLLAEIVRVKREAK